jgi:hypothetical protein
MIIVGLFLLVFIVVALISFFKKKPDFSDVPDTKEARISALKNAQNYERRIRIAEYLLRHNKVPTTQEEYEAVYVWCSAHISNHEKEALEYLINKSKHSFAKDRSVIKNDFRNVFAMFKFRKKTKKNQKITRSP